MKIFKKSKIILGTPVALFSVEIFLGMVFGYLFANFFSPRIKSITFNFGKYKFHLHHWLLFLSVLPFYLTYKFLPFLPYEFTSGFLGGLIFQGISCYNDWYKILVRS